MFVNTFFIEPTSSFSFELITFFWVSLVATSASASIFFADIINMLVIAVFSVLAESSLVVLTDCLHLGKHFLQIILNFTFFSIVFCGMQSLYI